MRRRSSWLWRVLLFLLRFKLTPVGRAAVVVMFASALGVITVEVPIYQVFCGMVALFGVAETTGLLMRPKLRVTGSLPERIAAGETAHGWVTVENLGRWPACDIMCGMFGLHSSLQHIDADTAILSLPPGGKGTLPVSVQAKKRGEYPLPEIHVHSTFPFNLQRFGRAVVPTRSLTVLPAFHRLEQFDVPISRRYQPGGIVRETRSGDAPEYVGNRDYVPGEPVRRLDFKAWAHVGRPVVREYQDEFCSRIALVLDTHLPRKLLDFGGQRTRAIEAAISLTASIADAVNETNSGIDLFAAGPDLFLFQTSTGTTHFESVLDILAAVEPTRHNPFESLSPVIAESLESISVAVCILVDWEETREELTRRIVECGCGLNVFLVAETPPAAPFS